MAFRTVMLKSRVTFANMEATTLLDSSHNGGGVDKVRRIVEKRRSEWESNIAAELQPVMEQMQPASLVRPIWQYCRDRTVHLPGSARRSQEQDFDLLTIAIKKFAFLQNNLFPTLKLHSLLDHLQTWMDSVPP